MDEKWEARMERLKMCECTREPRNLEGQGRAPAGWGQGGVTAHLSSKLHCQGPQGPPGDLQGWNQPASTQSL